MKWVAKIILSFMVIVVLSTTSAMTSFAKDDYPTRPVNFLVAYTPGGAMDIMARIIADVAPKYFPQVDYNK